jgi:hypothetical protein
MTWTSDHPAAESELRSQLAQCRIDYGSTVEHWTSPDAPSAEPGAPQLDERAIKRFENACKSALERCGRSDLIDLFVVEPLPDADRRAQIRHTYDGYVALIQQWDTTLPEAPDVLQP